MSSNARKRERTKQRKNNNLKEANPDGWRKHTEWHWSRSLNGLQLDYWPSTRKCQYKSAVYTNVCDIEELSRYLGSKS